VLEIPPSRPPEIPTFDPAPTVAPRADIDVRVSDGPALRAQRPFVRPAPTPLRSQRPAASSMPRSAPNDAVRTGAASEQLEAVGSTASAAKETASPLPSPEDTLGGVATRDRE
jgi:hypothetical protein